ncbi:predicted protein [Botrytis cinerea T4]|uniref:Uncharacterized protein n=1 Tax=Botryotinia fuckeliana (strain T4) TaxID=999810 RepID=G2XPB1_BOTF4|nr:predicted protein [Botrytis cinerea T4]
MRATSQLPHFPDETCNKKTDKDMQQTLLTSSDWCFSKKFCLSAEQTSWRAR